MRKDVFAIAIVMLSSLAPQPYSLAREKEGKVAGKNPGAETGAVPVRRIDGVDRIVFVRRNTGTADHYYTDHVNDRSKPGGNLCVLSLRDGKVAELVPEMRKGWFGRFDISFDARRIVFGWKKSPNVGYRIYEVCIDPATGERQGGVKQLTFPEEAEAELVKEYGKKRQGHYYHHGTDDMHPCYLPDGDIVFVSTRCRYGILCNNDDVFTTATLHRMDADGKNLRKLTNSAVSESSPCVMADGRVLYTRWEYVDKGHIGAKCLWAMRPDGTGSVEIYGNTISYPPTFIYGRPIPGKTSEFVFLGTPHCRPNSIGTVIRVDTRKGIRTRDAMTYMTPNVDVRTEKGYWYRQPSGEWKQDANGCGPLFKDPYPLTDEFFLVAHKPAGPKWDDPKAYGLYLLEAGGKVELLYNDPTFSCWQPFPLRKRPKPPVLSSPVDAGLAEQNQAVCVVTDVYHGLEGVERGTIKYIRILEQVPRPWAARRRDGSDKYGKAHVVLSAQTVLGLKMMHGIVPVEDDGSAHFFAPANRNIYFQVLDANFMAVQTERTYVNYMPGETRSCIGCHETPQSVPANSPARGVLEALKRTPSVPQAQPGDLSAQRTLHFPTDVQPVLDKHCATCHNPKKKSGGLDFSKDPAGHFSVSYQSLMTRITKDLGTALMEGNKSSVDYLGAHSTLSFRTPLVAMLSKGKVRLPDKKLAARAAELAGKHKKVELSREELLKISTWVDANCQYYGSYWGRRHVKYKRDPNFRPVVTFEQAVSPHNPTTCVGNGKRP